MHLVTNETASQAELKIIDVYHECDGEWHEFTSPQVPGLYVLAELNDLEAAYNDVPLAIKRIIEADTGQNVIVKVQQTYDQYEKKLPNHARPQVRHYSIEKLAA